MGKSERFGLPDGIAHVASRLPVPAEQLPTGTVIVHPPKTPTVESVAIYARVSSGDQKADLERQLGIQWCVEPIGGPRGERRQACRLDGDLPAPDCLSPRR